MASTLARDRKFRFGIQAGGPMDAQGWIALAQKAEALGYSSLSMPDHFGEQLAPIAALAAAAAATSTLRLNALVFDNDYRHPVVLAKEMATLDVLSGGRIDVGIGAGWLRTDYDSAGIQYDPIGVRLDRMVEAVAVLKGLFSPGPFSVEGAHYRITDLDGQPKPVQQPHPPFLLGGGGRRMLSIAAREADIVGINFNLKEGEIGPQLGPDATEAMTAQKVGWVREAAGPRFDEIELNVLVFTVLITEHRLDMAQVMAGGMGLTPEQVLEVPHFMIGTVDQLVEDLRRRRDAYGLSYVVVPGSAIEEFAPIVVRLAGS
jgi:probable F420-dependent oxidoreductase